MEKLRGGFEGERLKDEEGRVRKGVVGGYVRGVVKAGLEKRSSSPPRRKSPEKKEKEEEEEEATSPQEKMMRIREKLHSA